MANKTLQEHIFSTYLTLRYGVAIIGALLPLAVYALGAFHNVALQESISDYYWAPDGPAAPSRDWFVGSLFAVAACLYLYKGFSAAENIALNLAAVLALGVALFPTEEGQCLENCGKLSVHGFCAVSMFICLFYVVWFRAKDTLSLVPPGATPGPERYRQMYRVVALIMLASPLTAFVMDSLIGSDSTFIFFIEAAGIWAFALYWWLKSTELKKSGATIRALEGEVEARPSGSKQPVLQPLSRDHAGHEAPAAPGAG